MKNKIIISCLLIILTGCGSNNTTDLEDVSLMLDYTPNTNHIGIYVAQALGYYKDQGLNVKIIQPGNNIVESSVSTGSVDFGISFSENVLQARDKGLDIKSIMALSQENTSGLASFTNKHLDTPKDYENKTYCGWGTEVEVQLINQMARYYKIDEKSIKKITTNIPFSASQHSDCDFYWVYYGWDAIDAKLKKENINFVPIHQAGLEFYSPVIITSNEYIKKHKDIVQKFVNATILGYEYAYENPDKAADLFIKENPSYQKQFIISSIEFLNEYLVDDKKRFGLEKDEIWDKQIKFFMKQKIIKHIDLGEEYTNEFVNKYYKL